MRAIDFACRLLVKVATDPMTPAARLMLLCVAAGLECSADIARRTGMVPGTCTNLLRGLVQRHLLQRVASRAGDLYILAPAGREYVRQLLSFLPHGQAPEH